MCTVICRVDDTNAVPVQLLALRDELRSRDFDDPGPWWPGRPQVIGGRDRRAGGTWCVSDVDSGVTAVVLNRPERRQADAGAPSRGVLPLAAIGHGDGWRDEVDVTGMASFNLVLAEPGRARLWCYDGERIEETTLPPGTNLITPTGRSDQLDPRLRTPGVAAGPDSRRAPTDVLWAQWLAVLHDAVPGTDPAGLLVRHPIDGDSFETVFGQLIAARPGVLRLDYRRDPATASPWMTRVWEPGTEPG